MHCRRVMQVTLTVGVAVLFAAPGLAHPPAPVNERGRPIRGELHVWMHRAKVPLVHGRVEIRRAPCPANAAFTGCVFTAHPRILYLTPGRREPRRVLYHELGHTFDLMVLNARERTAFKRIVGIRRHGWFGGGLPPAEWFADGYAACAMHLTLRRPATPTPYGYAPPKRQHARVCRLIKSAAKPRGRPPQRPKNPPPVVEVQPPPPQDRQPSQGGGCNVLDQLLTGCTPVPPPPPPPPPPPLLPV
jgi:hypothetical protein